MTIPHDTDRLITGIARNAIAAHLGLADKQAIPEETYLTEPRACFVTLHKQGALRGCIGSLLAHRPLGEDIAANALAAALHDPRFPPLTADEFSGIDIEVSVLSVPGQIFPRDEAELISMLRSGVDGVILEYGAHRSTFLPQVWEQLPDPVHFLAHLKQKAGLAADFWSPGMRVSRYTVHAYHEHPEDAY